MIGRLRRAKDFVRQAAPAAARAMGDALRSTASAGTTPLGAAWKPKKDGGRPLVHAADAIEVKSIGSVLMAKVRMPEHLHSIGNARGRVRREIIPRAGLPPIVAEAIKKSLTEQGRAWLGGRS